MGTSWRHYNGNFSAGPGWQLTPLETPLAGPPLPRSSEEFKQGSVPQPRAGAEQHPEANSPPSASREEPGQQLASPGTRRPCFQPRGAPAMTGIEGIAEGQVRRSRCQPRRRQAHAAARPSALTLTARWFCQLRTQVALGV